MNQRARLLLVILLAGCNSTVEDEVASDTSAVAARFGVNVLVQGTVTEGVLATLGRYGQVRDVVPAIGAVTLRTDAASLAAIRALPFVVAANPDAERTAPPWVQLPVESFEQGLGTWNLDAINVTDWGVGRVSAVAGAGVYVAVLDTGLVNTWRYYFPTERIATEYARSFGGGGGDAGFVSSQPMKWEHDTNSHGTHVTSTILGYDLAGTPINGVAPLATVIPVKVLNQNGSGWSSVIARGILYVAELKAGPLAAYPVVINMSLGGPVLDAMEQAAIDYAIAQGVIIVASAGNEGEYGMGYPGAYAPVISVAAAGWLGEWVLGASWWVRNVADPTRVEHLYITDFSSRALAGQDLDVAAPGSWIVGPYQVNGQLGWYFLGGTSMASPHVAGLVALMAEVRPSLTAPQAEAILEGSALVIGAGCRTILDYDVVREVCWGANATGAGIVDALGAIAATP